MWYVSTRELLRNYCVEIVINKILKENQQTVWDQAVKSVKCRNIFFFYQRQPFLGIIRIIHFLLTFSKDYVC